MSTGGSGKGFGGWPFSAHARTQADQVPADARLLADRRASGWRHPLPGTRLKGSWALVRMRSDRPGKPQWLLIKHKGEYAEPGSDVAAEHQTSVTTGRTMEEING